MYQLTIDNARTGTAVTGHTDRPAACNAALQRYAVDADVYLHTIQATESHSSYDLVELTDRPAPPDAPSSNRCPRPPKRSTTAPERPTAGSISTALSRPDTRPESWPERGVPQPTPPPRESSSRKRQRWPTSSQPPTLIRSSSTPWPTRSAPQSHR